MKQLHEYTPGLRRAFRAAQELAAAESASWSEPMVIIAAGLAHDAKAFAMTATEAQLAPNPPRDIDRLVALGFRVIVCAVADDDPGGVVAPLTLETVPLAPGGVA